MNNGNGPGINTDSPNFSNARALFERNSIVIKSKATGDQAPQHKHRGKKNLKNKRPSSKTVTQPPASSGGASPIKKRTSAKVGSLGDLAQIADLSQIQNDEPVDEEVEQPMSVLSSMSHPLSQPPLQSQRQQPLLQSRRQQQQQPVFPSMSSSSSSRSTSHRQSPMPSQHRGHNPSQNQTATMHHTNNTSTMQKKKNMHQRPMSTNQRAPQQQKQQPFQSVAAVHGHNRGFPSSPQHMQRSEALNQSNKAVINSSNSSMNMNMQHNRGHSHKVIRQQHQPPQQQKHAQTKSQSQLSGDINMNKNKNNARGIVNQSHARPNQFSSTNGKPMHNRYANKQHYNYQQPQTVQSTDFAVQWEYGSDRNLVKQLQPHAQAQVWQAQPQPQAQAQAQPQALIEEDEWWYYVDPYKEAVSDDPVNKYELKRMFVEGYINEHCLVWNELYPDYITIHDVPELLNFIYDDVWDRRRNSVLPHTQAQAQAHVAQPQPQPQQQQQWHELYTADGRPYYRNVVSQQIVWSKPAVLRSQRTKPIRILLNNESIQHIDVSGVAVVRDTTTTNNKKSPVPNSPVKRMRDKAQQALCAEFIENKGDVRWIPHSKHGYVIAQFVKRDEKYSIYDPFDDSELFEAAAASASAAADDEKSKSKPKPIKIPTLKVKNAGMKIESWDCLDQHISDMVELGDLSAPYVLHNLKHRFLAKQIYTRVGDIIIAVNPYEMLPLYLPSVLESYKLDSGNTKTLEPHIYEIARACYTAIISTSRAQSIVISGESGAGKTECTKQILQFIAECAGNDNKIEQKLLSTNPILESFGNCRTVRNHNSSRFGKFIEIFFNAPLDALSNTNQNQIVKSFQTIYALEKVRVCNKSKDERNYHIFYQLIKGMDASHRKSLRLGKISNYAYLSGIDDAGPHRNDAEDFVHLNKAFNDIGCFRSDNKNTVFHIYRLCSAILCIGNILFEADKSSGGGTGEDGCRVCAKSQEAVKRVCLLLDIANSEQLVQALMFKSMFGMGADMHNKSLKKDVTKIALSVHKAYENRDALAKFLYNELFNWIVEKLNASLIDDRVQKKKPGSGSGSGGGGVAGGEGQQARLEIRFGYEDDEKQVPPQQHRVLSVLDIFGFEILERNSFEQLCVNYTNERLQYHFDQTVFRNEEDLYAREGVRWNAHSATHTKFNNLPVIELIDGKKTGIFSILDAQSSVPQSDDNTFMLTVNQIHEGAGAGGAGAGMVVPPPKLYENYVKKNGHFVIHHYAGKVLYDARGFMDKNRDELNTDLLQLLDQSKMELIRSVIGPTVREHLSEKKFNKSKKSLSRLYCESLNVLIQKLRFTESHYIRCIKPNDEKRPNFWMGKLVLDQLTYSGVFEAIKIKKNGFPFRGLHREFIDRFKLMADAHNLQKIKQLIQAQNIAECVQMMKRDLLGADEAKHNFQVGQTMVFYQHAEHRVMEKKRELSFASHITAIQNYFRMYRERRLLLAMARIRPKLRDAIASRNLSLLNAAIAESADIEFDMKLLRDAKTLKHLVQKEEQCEAHIKYVLRNDPRDVSQYVQDLSRAIAEADEIGYASETVQLAQQTLDQFTNEAKIRKNLRNAMNAFDIELIKNALQMAKFANIGDNDALVIDAQDTLRCMDEERGLLQQLQTAIEFGGYNHNGATINYNLASQIDCERIQAAVSNAERFKLRSKYGKIALQRARHILHLRVALQQALLARHNDELWNTVSTVINATILKAMPEMASNKEIISANNLIYIHYNDSFSEKFAAVLNDAMNRMDYNWINLQLSELQHCGANGKKQLSDKYHGLVTAAQKLKSEMEHIDSYLLNGLVEKNMHLLSIGVNKAQDIGYVHHEVFRDAHTFYTQYATFDERLTRALQEFDIDGMKALLEESEAYEQKHADAQLAQIRHLIYNTPPEQLLQLQLDAAVSERDPHKVCSVTLKLKKLFFDENGSKFEWHTYPLLLSPEQWAKSGGIFASRNKLKKSFYQWTNNPIHHSLTDLKKSKTGSSNDFFKKSALDMFKSMMGVMGDRHYQQPLSLIQDILVKMEDIIPLRNEFFAQLIKQMTNNPTKESRILGWNLLTVILDTLKPPKDIENYLEKWLRDNPPENKPDDAEFYVRLMHQTLFLGSRTAMPGLGEIEQLMQGSGVRNLTLSASNLNALNKLVSRDADDGKYAVMVTPAMQHSQSSSPPPPNLQIVQQPPAAGAAAQQSMAYQPQLHYGVPPTLTSSHQNQLKQQQITLRLSRTAKFGGANENYMADDDADRNRVYYCGYTMDDERKPNNNFHYAPHAKRVSNAHAHAIHLGQPGLPEPPPRYGYNHINASTTTPVREHPMLDL